MCFAIEIDTCACSGGKLRTIASIEEPAVIARILSPRQRTAPQPCLTGVPLGARAPPVAGPGSASGWLCEQAHWGMRFEFPIRITRSILPQR
jgi:hypothetical protein